MSSLSPLAILNEIVKRSPDPCSVEILSENPFECKISFQSYVTLGSASSKKKAIQSAAEEMLKLVYYCKKVSLNSDSCISLATDSNAEAVSKVDVLKKFCFLKQIAEPSFEVFEGSNTMENNTTVLVKCHIQSTSCIGFGENKEKAFDHSASRMLEHLKLKFSIPSDSFSIIKDKELENSSSASSMRSTSSLPSTDELEIAKVTGKYCSLSKLNGNGCKIPKSKLLFKRLTLANQHLAGKLDPFFTENVKMIELKNNALVLTHPDPFSLIKDICAVQNVKYSMMKFPTFDGSCCAAVQVHTNEMWTMISHGKNYDEAIKDASRRMLLFFKTLMA